MKGTYQRAKGFRSARQPGFALSFRPAAQFTAFALSLIHYFALSLLVSSCITDYEPDAVSIPPELIVEGQITDQPGPYTVKLTRTANYAYNSLNLLETGATVVIADNLGNQETLTEQGAGGFYRTRANGLRGVVGRSYRLLIQTKAGRRYESDPETLPAVPPIQKLYYESSYTPASGITPEKQSWTVYLDTTDPDTLGNYYQWSWANYEFTPACQKTFVSVPPPGYYRGVGCCSPCWDITRCYTCLNLNSDANINGKAISRQVIAEVPFTSLSRYYLEVQQQAISRGAYQFWKSVRQLTTNTGGLFDAAPATVRGNLRCVSDPTESVWGYFGATGLAEGYLYVDRSTGRGQPKTDFPTQIPVPGPPCIVCADNQYRTPNQPRWWTY